MIGTVRGICLNNVNVCFHFVEAVFIILLLLCIVLWCGMIFVSISNYCIMIWKWEPKHNHIRWNKLIYVNNALCCC